MIGSKVHFPGQLKKKYCANFIDTEESCTRRTLWLFEYALFSSGYHEDDIAPMVKFIDENKDLASCIVYKCYISSKWKKIKHILDTTLILLETYYILFFILLFIRII